jgi:cyclohexa-1,5-dienecarbonyl-CoA hydratase
MEGKTLDTTTAPKTETFLTTASDDGLCTIFIARPPVNVLHTPLMLELWDALDAAAADPGVRAVMITGYGQRVFSAGVAIDDHRPENMGQPGRGFNELVAYMRAYPLPLAAALNGAAVGGGLELAMACDMIISTPEAKIGQPEIKLASMAALAIPLLRDRVPSGILAEMVLGGETFDGARAYQVGLVNRLVSKENFLADCAAFMAQFTRLSRPVLMVNKEAVNRSRGRHYENEIEGLGALYRERLLPLEDAKEGLDAFEQKRAPQWKHR